MKHKIINALAALAAIGGLAVSTFAPWWVVWFVCFPVMLAGVFTLMARNTDNIKYYG